jgi:hypothetical protein
MHKTPAAFKLQGFSLGLFVFEIFWGFFIDGTGIPPQFETQSNQVAFPIGQVITKDCHCNRQPYIEGFSFSQVCSFRFHQTIFIELHVVYFSVPIIRP